MSASQISEEVWKEVLAAKYTYNERDGFRFVVKGGSLTLAKFLVRQLKLNETFKDHEVASMAQQIEVELLKDSKVIQCKTPEDYTDMFKAGDSCMTVLGHGTWGESYVNSVGKEILEKYNLWSSMWYHYNPHCEGYYLVAKKPVARCFLLDNGALGSLYGSGTGYIAALKKSLGDKFSSASNPYVKITKEFSIPGIETSQGVFGPIPNCDNFTKPFGVTFADGVFTYGPKGKKLIHDTYQYQQWINAKQCRGKETEHG